ncbi:acyl-CoA synthetase [Bacillus spizizenii]|uniref:acyl-CoA synthetase n=1 Tax=Bacillus spizizenii TaxID=96241 RepID=UPI0022801359|nr:acyl-CoA synthetase [Bacillus spizizenii]MCY7760721.1 acyl-CoA synthetase [Bacillus spizizenii]MCY8061796.1 acyl-CoA synthetase [Bacillus spizizenii]MCY8134048.1 acyl-CoA synthetase [Bacillus spizizenii]MCY8258053.1 acyl-CoA synthetase [Bacillus spizizenii]MCY8331591.1 acyl-CoA synthetase [Bacillus spizizenii]
MTITHTYSAIAEKSPGRVAIHTESEQITYRDWARLVSQTANWLRSQPSMPNRVAILLPNSLAFLQLFAGAAAAGCTAVPIDTRWSADECKERLFISDADLVITSAFFKNKLIDSKTPVVLLDHCMADISEASAAPLPTINSEHPFYMGFTSGSTGKPKAFTRSHRSWMESFTCTETDFAISSDDKVLVPGSLMSSHFLYGAVSTLFLGGTVCLLKKFSPVQTKEWLSRESVSVLYTVPTMTDALTRVKAFPNNPVKIISSGADWPAESKKKLAVTWPHLKLYDFYGTSELSFVTYSTPEDSKRKSHSAGRPFHNVQIEIRNAAGERCQPGEIGKIFVKSPMRFSGYVNGSGPDESGWITVDDMGCVDEDGFLYISGRENGMIVYGGLNIFPEEVERVLLSCPEIENAAVVGIPDEYWGEIAVAVIHGNTNARKLKAWCKQKLAAYKIPKKWVFTDSLPETSSGKIARSSVRKWLEEGAV